MYSTVVSYQAEEEPQQQLEEESLVEAPGHEQQAGASTELVVVPRAETQV